MNHYMRLYQNMYNQHSANISMYTRIKLSLQCCKIKALEILQVFQLQQLWVYKLLFVKHTFFFIYNLQLNVHKVYQRVNYNGTMYFFVCKFLHKSFYGFAGSARRYERIQISRNRGVLFLHMVKCETKALLHCPPPLTEKKIVTCLSLAVIQLWC